MKVLLVLLLASASPAFSSTEMLCSLQNGLPLYRELRTRTMNDKAKHCVLSCHLTLKCGGEESFGVGVLKELWDLMGHGTPDAQDLLADLAGIALAEGGRAGNLAECTRECRALYADFKE